jgi:hypothetical protein
MPRVDQHLLPSSATQSNQQSLTIPSTMEENRIVMEEKFGFCEASVVQICQRMPPLMDGRRLLLLILLSVEVARCSRFRPIIDLETGHVSKQEWEVFCSKIDKELKRLSTVRSFVVGVLIVYAIVMVAYYICVEHLDLLGNLRKTDLMTEVLISVAVLVSLIFLFILRTRLFAIVSVKRHCNSLMRSVCPCLNLRCNLSFFQFTGGIARGWYISVSRNIESA